MCTLHSAHSGRVERRRERNGAERERRGEEDRHVRCERRKRARTNARGESRGQRAECQPATKAHLRRRRRRRQDERQRRWPLERRPAALPPARTRRPSRHERRAQVNSCCGCRVRTDEARTQPHARRRPPRRAYCMRWAATRCGRPDAGTLSGRSGAQRCDWCPVREHSAVDSAGECGSDVQVE